MDLDSIRRNSLKLSEMSKSVVQLSKNNTQIKLGFKAFEDETVIFKTFQTIPGPLKLELFNNVFIDQKGIDPIAFSKDVDMEIPVKQLIVFLVEENKAKKKKVLDAGVKNIMKRVSQKVLSQINNDLNFFILPVTKEKRKKFEGSTTALTGSQAKKSGSARLLGGLALLLLF